MKLAAKKPLAETKYYLKIIGLTFIKRRETQLQMNASPFLGLLDLFFLKSVTWPEARWSCAASKHTHIGYSNLIECYNSNTRPGKFDQHLTLRQHWQSFIITVKASSCLFIYFFYWSCTTWLFLTGSEDLTLASINNSNLQVREGRKEGQVNAEEKEMTVMMISRNNQETILKPLTLYQYTQGLMYPTTYNQGASQNQ